MPKETEYDEFKNLPCDDLLSNFFKRVNWVEEKGHKEPALVFIKTDGAQVRYSWQTYKEKAIYFARALIDLGVQPGDFVAIIALNLPESFFALLGAILAGAVPVPISVPLVKNQGQVDLKAILGDCKPKLVTANEFLEGFLKSMDHVTFEELIGRGELCLASHRAEQRKLIYLQKERGQLLIMPYTSGTGAEEAGQKLKGVMLSHENILDRIEAVTNELKINRHDRLLSYLILGHISELVATFFGQIYKGYTVYFTEYAKEMVGDREKLIKNLPAVLRVVQPTVFLGVPKVWKVIKKKIGARTKFIPSFILSKLVKRHLGFGSTRHFVSAGSKIDQKTLDLFRKLGIEIKDVYGQTETAGPILIDGKPIGKVKVFLKKVLDKETGEEIGQEIAISGKSVMLGYYKNSQATQAAIETAVSDKDIKEKTVFYKSGDFGEETADGKILCLGRADDSIKHSNGEFTPCQTVHEMESNLKEIPGVEDALVCGDGKPYTVALIFTAYKRGTREFDEFSRNIKKQIPKIGEGFHRIGGFEILNSSELEHTPSMKLKKKMLIKKFKDIIDKL